MLTTALAGTPDVRITYDAGSRSIAVLAPPSIHACIEEFIAILQTGSPLANMQRPAEAPRFPALPPARDPNRL